MLPYAREVVTHQHNGKVPKGIAGSTAGSGIRREGAILVSSRTVNASNQTQQVEGGLYP